MSKTEHIVGINMRATITDEVGKKLTNVWVPGIIVDVSNHDELSPTATVWLGGYSQGTTAKASHYEGTGRTYLTFVDGHGSTVKLELEMTPGEIIEALEHAEHIGKYTEALQTA
jgi:hypothetical protein